LSPPPPIDEPAVATETVAPVTSSSSSAEPLFTVQVWQLGLVAFVVLLALLYALGIL
jgi:hypothetical protein